MTPFTILFAVLPALALANPAPARGGANSAAGPITCVTKDAAPLFAQSSSNMKFRGSYANGVGVFLQCYLTGLAPFDGNKYWDKTADGLYIPESFFTTACAYQLPPC